MGTPSAAGQEPPDLRTVALDPSSGPAALAEAAYATTAARLPDAPEPQWRLYGSVAAAIPGASDADAKNLTNQVGDLHDLVATFGQPDNRFSRLFAGVVAKDTAYHRAMVDYALNKLHYLGYADRFSRDLRETADDPNAFPDGTPTQLPFYEDPGNNFSIPKDFRHDPPLTTAEILAVAMRAKSPTVAAGFIHGLSEKPSDADVRALAAKYLAFPDPRARWAMVERLSWWNGYPAPDKATTVIDEATRVPRTDYPGLDEAVAHWKAKLGV